MFNGTRPHIILMIGDDGIVAVPHDIANASVFFVPTENKNGAQIIDDFINRYPNARLTLCADNLAQDYRVDALPPLTIFDRAKLIKRRLQQSFPLARVTTSRRFTKSKNQILLIGLNGNNAALQWADRLRGRMPRLTLLPVEAAQLLAKLSAETTKGWAMLVSRQKTGGFRQIVTHKGNLVFTRLTPLPSDGEDQSNIIVRDIQASLDYLTRLGLQNAHDLSVLLLMQNLDLSPFADLSLQSLQCLPPLAAAQKLRLPFASDNDDSADVFYAASFAETRPALSLMLPDAKNLYLNKQTRFWGMRAASACLAFSLIFAVCNAADLFSTLYQTEQETTRLNATQNELAQAQANAAPLTEPLGRLRQALARRHIYEQETPTPWHGLNEIAAALTDDSKIIHIDWENKTAGAPEKITIGMRMTTNTDATDRAAIVTRFSNITQNIALAAADYDVVETKPPFPALPQETVTAETTTSAPDPTGDIILQRKTP